MNNKDKKIPWITSTILGILSVIFISLYGATLMKYNSLKSAIKNKNQNNFVRIWAQDSDGTKILDEIYLATNEETNLQDILESKPSHFKLTDISGTYGKMIEQVKNTTTDTWVRAIYNLDDGYYWALHSPTYDKKYNYSFEEFMNNTDKGDYMTVGAQGASITRNEIFVLIKTKDATFE